MDKEQVIALRPARRQDASAIARCVMRAYQPYVARMGMPPAPMRHDYKAVIARQLVWVAEEGWTLHGVLVAEEEGDALLLNNLAVDPDFQGHGTGMRLLRLAEDLAAQAGLTEVHMYINEAMVENLVFYQKRGYRELQRRQENGYHRIYLGKSLGR
ncbi:GNAT family N-acetyltransferase [Alloalcanivorax mobilis]|uniref:GNAT family N-acetyltransferase n=1 Tax=Alloalcanivorax mobilis TaxID=2019569 RepID=UPI000C75ADCF|nr:GNAT family N-acetyltransferase [Alloalcanivorax mobilis]